MKILLTYITNYYEHLIRQFIFQNSYLLNFLSEKKNYNYK